MHVTEIRVSGAHRGGSVQIMECGGVHLGPGDCMLVMASIAKRMVAQYRGKLVQGSDLEVEKLKGGHYQVITQNSIAQAAKAPEPAPESTEAVDPYHGMGQAEQAPAEVNQPSDRSMGDNTGKPKRKRKKG